MISGIRLMMVRKMGRNLSPSKWNWIVRDGTPLNIIII